MPVWCWPVESKVGQEAHIAYGVQDSSVAVRGWGLLTGWGTGLQSLPTSPIVPAQGQRLLPVTTPVLDSERLRRHAQELVALSPNVILAVTVSSMVPLQQATRTLPIVFVQVTDAVGAGFVESLSRPGGNATGFSLSEYGFSAKWIELLKQIDPRITRAGVLRDPSNPSGIGLLAAIQGAGAALNVEVSPLGVRDVGEIERVIAAFAQRPNGGLVLVPTALTVINRQLISQRAINFLRSIPIATSPRRAG